MIALADGTALELFIQFIQVMHAVFFAFIVHPSQAVCRRCGIMHGAVGIFEADAQALAERPEFMGFHVGVELARKGQRVQHRPLPCEPQTPELSLKNRTVKSGVMGSDRGVPDEFHKLWNHGFSAFLVGKHIVRDTGELGHFRRYGHMRIDENRQGILNGTAHQAHCTDFNGAAGAGVQASRLKIQNNDRFIKRTV